MIAEWLCAGIVARSAAVVKFGFSNSGWARNRVDDLIPRLRNEFLLIFSPEHLEFRFMRKTAVGTILLLFIALSTVALNSQSVDISAVAAAGAVSENKYTNSFFKLTVDAHNATLKLNPLINTSGKRARLMQALAPNANREAAWSFAVLADSLGIYPQLQSSAQYVRSVRHQLEKQGLSTEREEFPITIAGAQFTGAIMQEPEPSGLKHYRGFYSTFLEGYILSFDAEASTENRLDDLVTRIVTFTK
jgi:hypothetical protein